MGNNSNIKRTVAFLDILGFRSMIKRFSIEELSKKYERLIDKTDYVRYPLKLSEKAPRLFPHHPLSKPWCYKHIFSDSIILISHDQTDECCLKLLIYTWRLIQVCITSGMPIRGGVAFGDLYMNLNKNIILGGALTKAFDLENKQNWIGVSIDKSVEERFVNLFKLFKDSTNVFYPLFFKYYVPFKNGTKEKLHTINWRLNLIVEKGTRSLFKYNRDEGIKEKVANTLQYAKSVVKSGQVYDFREELQVELRAFLHGAFKRTFKAPYKHGDDL